MRKEKHIDRFERAVEKHVHKNQCNMPVIHAERAASLLRAEHAWMRRQIEQIDRTRLRKDPDTPPNIQIGIAAALDDLERRLAKRRK